MITYPYSTAVFNIAVLFLWTVGSFSNPYTSYMMQSPTRQQQKEGKDLFFYFQMIALW